MSHIIIAEDDAGLRGFIEIALKNSGHRVTACEDGTAAFAAMKDPNNKPDLLLTDIVMPGMDGVELATRARLWHPNLPVVYITGFAVGEGQKLDGQVLSKPLHLNQLLVEINRQLAKGPLLLEK
jgi:two-component system, cell cycle response regulator CpdR